MVVILLYYYIGYKYKATTWYLTGFKEKSNAPSPMVVTLGQQLQFLTFSVLVANPKKLLFYTVANPARGLPNREKKKKSAQSRILLGMIIEARSVNVKKTTTVCNTVIKGKHSSSNLVFYLYSGGYGLRELSLREMPV